MNSGDSESGESNCQGEDKNIIDQILGQMKSEFNKTDKKEETSKTELDSSPSSSTEEPKTEDNSTNESQENEDKPRIILSFKKPNSEVVKTGRAVRQKNEESVLKRSARRRSKDCNESVLQSAIARKEKSYNEASKPQRLTRQLKPTQKILENLAIAKQEKCKNEKTKVKGNDGLFDIDKIEGDKNYRKHKHKSHHKHPKKAKKLKCDSGKESDSDQSVQEENKTKSEDSKIRKSRRLSTSICKDDLTSDGDELSLQELLNNDDIVPSPKTDSLPTKNDPFVPQFCLCTKTSQYYLTCNDDEFTYCAAVDSIGNKIVGCSRLVDTKETMLMRPSTRVPYMIMCEAHRNRMLRHNCCPTCGFFCTQGKFLECEAKHHYHRDCHLLIGNVQSCPHCGTSTPSSNISITMHSSKKPVFLPEQRAQYVSARMAFPNNRKNHDESKKCVTPPLLPIGALDMQNTLEYGDEEYEMADLVAAVRTSSVEKVAVILGSKSVDISAKLPECNEGTILHLASQRGCVPIVHMLIVAGAQPDCFDKEQGTPLMVAILNNHSDVVQYLIKTGASLDLKGSDGMTALHLAAKSGNLKACELLLRAATGIKNYVNGQDDGGWTPLVWACEHGYADIANFLMYKGADPSLRDVEHNVALHWAAFSGSAHIADLLLNKGCAVNAVNAHGDSPLHIGARQDMYDCNIVLLARGADVTLLNKNSETPLDCVPPGGDSYSPIALNITLQSSVEYGSCNVVLCNDISRGKETNPVQCCNNVDSELQPLDFHYVTKNCLTSDIKIDNKISSLQYCDCEERCVDDGCFCGKLSVRCWYDEEGKLVPEFSYTDIPMIFECNDRCSCNAITCNNRVVQKGLTQRFELFKSDAKGWGIRTLRVIPKGSFVCEYVGEIITDVEADRREDDSFLFDLENRVCKSASEIDTYCIDAKFYGNFARFINHSCSPNLTSVKVFVDHQDLRFPRIAFFANRDIVSDEELSFDYGEKFWMAKYKSLYCVCGSSECRYSEDTIELSVQNHQRKLDECS